MYLSGFRGGLIKVGIITMKSHGMSNERLKYSNSIFNIQ